MLHVTLFCITLNIFITCTCTLHLFQSDICHGTFATLETVERCPRNATDIERRSRGKKCDINSPCQEDPSVYHCVRYEDRLVEVCAPRGLITGEYLYNTFIKFHLGVSLCH